MKVYPYIKEDNRNNYCEKMETYCSNLGGNYIKLNKYFIKYWKDCELFNFTNLDNNMIKNRTNNICESFHHKLNKKISHYHPKMSFLVNGLKNITKEYYKEYIKTLSIVNKKKEETRNYIAEDIFEFVKKFVKDTKETFDLDSFIQNISKDGESFYKLLVEIMDKVSDTDEDVIESIRKIFVEKKLIKNVPDIAELEEEEEEKGEENEIEENLEENNENVQDKNKNLKKDYKYLLKGDIIMEEKNDKKKVKNKKVSKFQNILNELDV